MYDTCEVCGASFNVTPSQMGMRRTCSLKCRSKLRNREPKPRIKLTCEFCGCVFETYPSRSSQRRCSLSCPGPDIEQWSIDLAYAVGLITADGCLDRDVKRIEFANKEQTLIDWMARWMPRSHVYPANHGIQQACSVWPNFYRFLLDVGLTPAKSLTLGALNVPDKWFFHFYRGLHDGDGTTHYHRNSLHLVLASHAPAFRRWVRQTIERLSAIPVSEDDRSLHMYANSAEQFARLVWRPDVFCLERKRPRNL